MSYVFLLRHARAAWAEPGMRDFDRPLSPEGLDEAAAMGVAMRAAGFRPAWALCSPAARARSTLKGIAGPLHFDGRIEFHQALYSGGPREYVEAARRSFEDGALLIVGHNPMIEEAATALASEGDRQALDALRSGFPTTGLAVIRLDRNDAVLAGSLEAFLTPTDF